MDASVFDEFDYVALGHIHGPQNIGGPRIRYCGTPLKYSFSEVKHEKSVSVVELGHKGELDVRLIPLVPYRDMQEIRGTYEEVTARSYYEHTTLPHDYLRVTLTDEEDVPDAVTKLRMFYPFIMKLDYDNTRTRHKTDVIGVEKAEEKQPLELFMELYEQQNGRPMDQEQCDYVQGLIEEIWEEQIHLDYLIDAYQAVTGKNPDLSFFGIQDEDGNYWIDLLSGSDSLRRMIIEGKTADEIKASWKEEIESFLQQRKPYLLYADTTM